VIPALTGTRLDPILRGVAQRATERRRQRSLADLRAELEPDPARRARFRGALAADGLSIIAECKRCSPSVGQLSTETDLGARAAAYGAGGARVLSILTEQDHFRGSPGDLLAVAGAGLPRLRKDFILDEAMVLESVAMGADAVLLLAVCLPDPLLSELRACAREAGLAVLLEVHSEAELERALVCEPDALGVNARDLTTFVVDLATVERLMPLIPTGPDAPAKVAESGIHGPAELLRVARAGADGALIGEALMRAADPAATLRAWREVLDA
jgi:indole-3-glycerol phosphate synthase